MDILRRESKGIEFFSVQTTGESGMSQSGLARMCGVTQKAVDNLLVKTWYEFMSIFSKILTGKRIDT